MTLLAEIVGYAWLGLLAGAIVIIAAFTALDSLHRAVRSLRRPGRAVSPAPVLPLRAGAPPAHPRRRPAA